MSNSEDRVVTRRAVLGGAAAGVAAAGLAPARAAYAGTAAEPLDQRSVDAPPVWTRRAHHCGRGCRRGAGAPAPPAHRHRPVRLPARRGGARRCRRDARRGGAEIELWYRCWPESRYVEIRNEIHRLARSSGGAPVSFPNDPFPAMVCPEREGQAIKRHLRWVAGRARVRTLHAAIPFSGEDFGHGVRAMAGRLAGRTRT